MKNPAAFIDRMPKTVLFGVAAVIQVVLIGLMVVDRTRILRDGVDVTLLTRPVDPRDFLRGDYVVLGYDISTVPAGALKGQPAAGKGATVFVKLAPSRDGFHRAVSVHAEPVAVTSPEVLIRGHVTDGANCGPARRAFCDRLQVRYNIERYFVPEGDGKKLEQVRNQRRLTVIAAVTPAGRAAIRRLSIDGKPLYDEPWF